MKRNTQEEVYNNIKFFVFNGTSLKDSFGEMPELRKWVNDLFDDNLKSVKPFDELSTAHIRIFYAVNDWESIIDSYYEEGINILSEEYDIIKAAAILHDYILFPEKFKKRTRVKL